ncbi:MAG: hypothetical protein ACI80V_001280 [Rhodothermales bacterium]|jgi:hypothetical protein
MPRGPDQASLELATQAMSSGKSAERTGQTNQSDRTEGPSTRTESGQNQSGGSQGGSSSFSGSDQKNPGSSFGAETVHAEMLGGPDAPPSSIFEMPSVEPVGPSNGPATALDARVTDVMEQWFADGGRSSAEQALANGRGRIGTVASAWLRSVRSSLANQPTKNTSEWKEVTIDLEDGLGSLNIRARRGAEQLSVHILASDLGTQTALASATERLESELRNRYGADVNLSFGTQSGSQDGGQSGGSSSGPQTRNGVSADGSIPADQSETSSLRGADRVWVG